jgi:hypothetical protein
MMNGYKYIEELLERFFDGETSDEEERRLYRFFEGEDIPPHLRRYKPVFAYFAGGLEKEISQPAGPAEPLRQAGPERRLRVTAGVAASLLILLAAGLLFFKKTDAFDPYEGSYIVRNGVRITDTSLIRPELEAAVCRALQQQENADRLLGDLSGPDTRLEEIQQETDRQNEEIINRFPDEIKESVRNIIENK